LAYHADKQKEYRHRKRWYVYNYLQSHPCIDCGESDHVVLEFDHVRGEKVKSISKMVATTYSLESLIKEIEKCEVRCANCHRRITAKRGGHHFFLGEPDPGLVAKKAPELKHGTRHGYRRGCRCDECKNAHNTYAKAYSKKMRLKRQPKQTIVTEPRASGCSQFTITTN
jgi:ribosomal protein S27E